MNGHGSRRAASFFKAFRAKRITHGPQLLIKYTGGADFFQWRG
jgi:hypothetical protein